jgi:hypothetical protein
MKKKATAIGIDGGATKISGGIVKQLNETTFSIDGDVQTLTYSESPLNNRNFQPVDLDLQLTQKDNPLLQTEEVKQGQTILECCESVINKLAKTNSGNKYLLGIGMPGLKSPDQKGIMVTNNGPRSPRFLDVLEHRLRLTELNFDSIQKLENDSDLCGLGELYGKNGSFREVENALYIGTGTGIADAILLDGKIIPFDNIGTWMPKSWQLKNENGIPIEKIISHKGMMMQYSKKTGISFQRLEKEEIYPELFIKKDDAVEIRTDFVYTVAWLIFQRAEKLFEKKPTTTFNRIILGLRLAQLIEKIPELFVEIKLSVKKQIRDSQVLNQTTKKYYLQKNLLSLSKLLHAPIIGAGVSAYQNA